MFYRNARTGELVETPGRDARLESVADDSWLPVPAEQAAVPFPLWELPPSLEQAIAAVPADEQETP